LVAAAQANPQTGAISLGTAWQRKCKAAVTLPLQAVALRLSRPVPLIRWMDFPLKINFLRSLGIFFY
jgi:hypothetical protein